MKRYLTANENNHIAKIFSKLVPLSVMAILLFSFIKFIFNGIVNKIFFTTVNPDTGALIINRIQIPFISKGYLANPSLFRSDRLYPLERLLESFGNEPTEIYFKPFYIIECLTYALYEIAIPLVCTVGLILLIKAMISKSSAVKIHRAMKLTNTVLLFNSAMTLLFTVIFAFGLMSFATSKGFNVEKIASLFDYVGLNNLYIKDFFTDIVARMNESTPFRVSMVILADVLVLAFGIAQFVALRMACNHHTTVSDVLDGKEAIEFHILPVIATFAFAGFSAIIGIVMIVNLTFVSALLNLAIALYFTFQGIISLTLVKTKKA